MPENLTEDGRLHYDTNTSSLELANPGTPVGFGMVGSQVSLVITGQNGDGSVNVRLVGLPQSDPQSEGRLWVNNGVLMVSGG